MRKNCPVEGVANLLRYSCDTKHLVLVYEHFELGPLTSLVAAHVSNLHCVNYYVIRHSLVVYI